MQELDAFAAEAAATEATILQIEGDQWGRPGLGSWTVAELVAHLVRAADRIDAYLDLPVEGSGPVCDRVGYFEFDHLAAAPGVAQRSREDAARTGVGGLAAAFAAAWRRTVQRCEGLPPDHLLQTFRGPMGLAEYAATRVLELVVHHMDLRQALDLPPAATPEAARITVEVLEGLLDGPRPRNLGRDRFIRVATGRLPSDDPRFPVLR